MNLVKFFYFILFFQTVSLYAPVGKCSEQTLPLKNAGNIDVCLKLKVILTFYFSDWIPGLWRQPTFWPRNVF